MSQVWVVLWCFLSILKALSPDRYAPLKGSLLFSGLEGSSEWKTESQTLDVLPTLNGIASFSVLSWQVGIGISPDLPSVMRCYLLRSIMF